MYLGDCKVIMNDGGGATMMLSQNLYLQLFLLTVKT